MISTSLSLSIEEFAFGLGLAGGAEAAAGLLASTVGELSDVERNARLTAASHSLLARGLLSFDAIKGQRTTLPEFEQLVGTVLHASTTIRATRFQKDRESVLTFFVDQTASRPVAVGSRIVDAVTIMLNMLKSRDDCIEAIAQFIEASSLPTLDLEKPTAVAGTELLDLLRKATPTDDLSAIRYLNEHNIAPDLAAQIVQQTRAATRRGSVLSLQTDAQSGNIDANIGFIFAMDAHSGWLFAIEPNSMNELHIFPATASAMARICRQILPEF